jgi:hypothetical protein
MSKKRNVRMNLEQLIDPETAPAVITIHYNNTVTRLMRSQRSTDDTYYWVGTPEDRESRPCRYSLIVEPNGYMMGSAAINFITNGGWGRSSGRPDAVLKSQVAAEFRKVFLQACIIHGQLAVDWTESLVKELSTQSGIPVIPGDITEDDLTELTLLGVQHSFIQVAHANGLRFDIDISKLMGRRVSDGYAIVMPGQWDDESQEVALTSCLSQADVFLLRRKGLKFGKVAQLKRK